VKRPQQKQDICFELGQVCGLWILYCR